MNLREFGQVKIQPLLMRVASNKKFKDASEKLLPIVTIPDCSKCPALEYCLKACVGFKNLYEERRNARS